MNLLDVKNLEVTFQCRGRPLAAVRKISFSLQRGEKLGIVGESGCGKSVTAKALVKLTPSYACACSGEICFNGKNLAACSEKEMQKVRGNEIGMIFQDPMTSLNPTMKIGAQIAEGFLRHHPDIGRKEVEKNVLEMLDLVGIPPGRSQDYPHTLSGGMRQRAMIALALICKPKLLLADEPTTSLDVTIQAQILDLLQEIQQKMGMSIILITHDLSVVAQFCDRVLVMYAGQIVEEAPVERLFESPQHPYTQKLLQSIPRLNRDRNHPLIPIEGHSPDLLSLHKGCPFWRRCSEAMQICKEENPYAFPVGEGHKSFCWKHHPRNG